MQITYNQSIHGVNEIIGAATTKTQHSNMVRREAPPVGTARSAVHCDGAKRCPWGGVGGGGGPKGPGGVAVGRSGSARALPDHKNKKMKRGKQKQ